MAFIGPHLPRVAESQIESQSRCLRAELKHDLAHRSITSGKKCRYTSMPGEQSSTRRHQADHDDPSIPAHTGLTCRGLIET